MIRQIFYSSIHVGCCLIYQLAIHLLGIGLWLAGLFHSKAKLLARGQRNAIEEIRKKAIPEASYLWFHAASLGEFEQGRPVIEKLKADYPSTKILLTFFSPSGYEVRKNYPEADIIAYLPADTKTNARKLLTSINITAAIFIKYEFWPNFINELSKNKIPIYAISAIFRADQAFFKWYGKWYKHWLYSFECIFVQDADSLQLLQEHNLQNAALAGDTRFDRVVELTNNNVSMPLIDAFLRNGKRIIVAGSTWPKDEALLACYLHENNDVKLIIAPHEIHEGHLLQIHKTFYSKTIRYSEANVDNVQNVNCLIIDTFGMLSSVYKYADVAYVGGGFGAGIHNILEAAVWNVPVIFGPNYRKFREAIELNTIGGALPVKSYEALSLGFDHLFHHQEAGIVAGNYVRNKTGATDMITKELANLI